jgi:hypothetical protein
MCNGLLDQGVDMSSQVWLRLQRKYSDWPFKLPDLVDSRVSAAVRAEICEEFATLPPCELDPGFTAVLRDLVPVGRSIDEYAHELLEALSKQCRMSNMHVERLFAAIKRASMGNPRKPTIERYCVAGSLSQRMSAFLSAGNEDIGSSGFASWCFPLGCK